MPTLVAPVVARLDRAAIEPCDNRSHQREDRNIDAVAAVPRRVGAAHTDHHRAGAGAVPSTHSIDGPRDAAGVERATEMLSYDSRAEGGTGVTADGDV